MNPETIVLAEKLGELLPYVLGILVVSVGGWSSLPG